MPQEPIQRGDVYWITYAFPHEKASSMANEDGIQKQRPILILQNGEDNRSSHYPLVLAAPITTQKTERVYAQDTAFWTGPEAPMTASTSPCAFGNSARSVVKSTHSIRHRRRATGLASEHTLASRTCIP